jgi:hypothetical protein
MTDYETKRSVRTNDSKLRYHAFYWVAQRAISISSILYDTITSNRHTSPKLRQLSARRGTR